MNEYMEKLKEIWGPHKEARGYMSQGDTQKIMDYLAGEFPVLVEMPLFKACMQKADVPASWRASRYMLDVDIKKAPRSIPAKNIEDVIYDGLVISFLTQSLTWDQTPSKYAPDRDPVVYRDLAITSFVLSKTSKGYQVRHGFTTGDIDMERLESFSGNPRLNAIFQRCSNNDEVAVMLQAQEWRPAARRPEGFVEKVLEKILVRDVPPQDKVIVCKSFALN
ncbi:MAG: hypothetical protein GC136_08365 [Alphaproteobacteria bacterium]|nr:hypothetical protein [Alphaproteobacteria bacterium]